MAEKLERMCDRLGRTWRTLVYFKYIGNRARSQEEEKKTRLCMRKCADNKRISKIYQKCMYTLITPRKKKERQPVVVKITQPLRPNLARNQQSAITNARFRRRFDIFGSLQPATGTGTTGHFSQVQAIARNVAGEIWVEIRKALE